MCLADIGQRGDHSGDEQQGAGAWASGEPPSLLGAENAAAALANIVATTGPMAGSPSRVILVSKLLPGFGSCFSSLAHIEQMLPFSPEPPQRHQGLDKVTKPDARSSLHFQNLCKPDKAG